MPQPLAQLKAAEEKQNVIEQVALKKEDIV